MDFIHPERFLIKSVKSQGKTYDKAQNHDKYFFSFYVAHHQESNGSVFLFQP
jgi:hypothetical protein